MACAAAREENTFKRFKAAVSKVPKHRSSSLPPAKRTTGKTRPKNDRGAYPSNLFRLVSFQKRAWSPPCEFGLRIPFTQSGCDTLVLNCTQLSNNSLQKPSIPLYNTLSIELLQSKHGCNRQFERDHSRIISTSKYA